MKGLIAAVYETSRNAREFCSIVAEGLREWAGDVFDRAMNVWDDDE